jgi:hypothetical protein
VPTNKIPESVIMDLGRNLDAFMKKQDQMIGKISSSLDKFDSIPDRIGKAQNSIFEKIEKASSQINLGSDIGKKLDSLVEGIAEQNIESKTSSEKILSIFKPAKAEGERKPADLASILSSLPKFKDGGKVKESGMGIVGDVGPEVVLLPKGAEVVPLKLEDVFKETSQYFKSIDPAISLKEIFGSDDLIFSKSKGEFLAYRKKANSEESDDKFGPISLTKKFNDLQNLAEETSKNPASTDEEMENSREKARAIRDLMDLVKTTPARILEESKKEETAAFINTEDRVKLAAENKVAEEKTKVENTVESLSQPAKPLNPIKETVEDLKGATLKKTEIPKLGEPVSPRQVNIPKLEEPISTRQVNIPELKRPPATTAKAQENTKNSDAERPNEVIVKQTETFSPSAEASSTAEASIKQEKKSKEESNEASQAQFQQVVQMMSEMSKTLSDISSSLNRPLMIADGNPIRPRTTNF